MLQTVSFTLYLALGAGIFAALEGWEYSDAVYWADYTVLTIGLGSDFPLETSAGRGVLIPYASGGILLIGIVIGSVRGLVLERGGIKMMQRRTAKERDRGMDEVVDIADQIQNPDEALQAEFEAMRRISERAEISRKYYSLGISCFVFLLVWFLGAMVFFYTEVSIFLLHLSSSFISPSIGTSKLGLWYIVIFHLHCSNHHRLWRLGPQIKL